MIRAAVIPAAGRGTRMRSITRGAPKEMLIVGGKPVIQHVVEEAVASGIDDIIIVVSPGKEAIRKHFSRAQGSRSVLRILDRARIRFAVQKQQRGLGHAVACARKAVGKREFAVLLGDVIMVSPTPMTRRLIRLCERKRAPVMALKAVPPDQVSRYGIVAGRAEGRDVFRITSIVEKPDRKSAPSNLAVASRYVLTPDIFGLLARQPAGRGNEIQLTDAIARMLADRPVFGLRFRGERFDLGTKEDFLRANVAFAFKRRGAEQAR